jgi:hypothetical protein
LFFECLMLFLEFRNMRLHRHAVCLLNHWLFENLSLPQTQRKGDGSSTFAPQQRLEKPLIGWCFPGA